MTNVSGPGTPSPSEHPGSEPPAPTNAASQPEPEESRWTVIKYRLAIAGMIGAVFFLLFIMFVDSALNMSCSPLRFFTFQCNRFDASEH
jgi:hypothetical protein